MFILFLTKFVVIVIYSSIEVYGKTKKFPPLNDKEKWEKAVSDADEALKLPQEDRTKLLFDFSQEDSLHDSEEGWCTFINKNKNKEHDF